MSAANRGAFIHQVIEYLAVETPLSRIVATNAAMQIVKIFDRFHLAHHDDKQIISDILKARDALAKRVVDMSAPCTDPAACDAEGCRNPWARCDEAVPATQAASMDTAEYDAGRQQGAGELPQDERAAFEAWAEAEYDLEQADGSNYRIPKGSYLSGGTTQAWHVWQAALAQRAASVPNVTCQIYGHVVGHCAECNVGDEGAAQDAADTNKVLADNYLKSSAASVQAEAVQPVAYVDPAALAAFVYERKKSSKNSGPYARKWMWANPAEKLVPLYAVPVPAASVQAETITLTGHQLRIAADFINPDGLDERDQLDDDLTFGMLQHQDDDGNISTGMCCWNDDTDGVLPLDGEYDAASVQADGEREFVVGDGDLQVFLDAAVGWIKGAPQNMDTAFHMMVLLNRVEERLATTVPQDIGRDAALVSLLREAVEVVNSVPSAYSLDLASRINSATSATPPANVAQAAPVLSDAKIAEIWHEGQSHGKSGYLSYARAILAAAAPQTKGGA